MREGQELDPFRKTVVSALQWKEGDKELRSRKVVTVLRCGDVQDPLRCDDHATGTGGKAWLTPFLAKCRSLEDLGFDVLSDGSCFVTSASVVPPRKTICHETMRPRHHDCPRAGHRDMQTTYDTEPAPMILRKARMAKDVTEHI